MSSPNSGPRRHILDACLIFGLLGLTFLFGCFRMWDTDIWWHLRTGQLIAQRVQSSPWPWDWVPQTDWYTFTSADRPWIDLHWGFQLVMAGLYTLGGVPLLTLFKAMLSAAAIGLCLAARQKSWSIPVTVACWLPALIVFSGRLYERPEILTLVFLAAYLAILFHAQRRPRLLWLLPALQVVWVNCHALFVFGPVVFSFFLADRALTQLWRRCRPIASRDSNAAGGAADAGSPSPFPGPSWRLLLSVAAMVAAACFLNPYGWRGVWFPVELSQKASGSDPYYAEHIWELRSVRAFIDANGWRAFRNPYFAAHLAAIALGLVSFVAKGLSGKANGRLDLFRLLLFAGFSYLGWQATRNNNHFALVAGFVTAANFAEAFNGRRAEGGGRRAGKDGSSGPRRLSRFIRPALAMLLAALAWSVVSGCFYAWAGEKREFGLGERTNWYPHGAARFAGRPGMPRDALIVPWGHAGTYIFHNAPQHRVFTDPRLEVNLRDTLERYDQIVMDMAARNNEWQRSLAAGLPETPAVVIGRHDPLRLATASLASEPGGVWILSLLGDTGWRCVYCDAAGAVFVETATAERLGMPQADLRPLLEIGW